MNSPRLERPVITVDGLAGSGKTSLSRAVAHELGFEHLNSGLLYRGVGWLCLKNGIDVSDEAAVSRLLETHTVELRSAGELLVDGIDRAAELTAPAVSEATSKTSLFPAVRAFLLRAQQEAFPGEPLVAEGRDMGTVVFPDAVLKFFVRASVAVRVARRLRQLAEQGVSAVDETEIRREIMERDERDTTRVLSPTRAAHGAVEIDNSDRPMADTVAAMCRAAKERGIHPKNP